MSAKTDAILDSLKNLSLLEASELVKQIEETFGVKRTKNEWDFEEPIENLLREDHIREIEDYLESDGIPWIEGYVRAALRGIVERWYESMEANET